MRAPLLVVCPGRCASSFIAKELIELGVFMGSRFVPAGPANPLGHFEDREFYETNLARKTGGLRREQWITRIQALVQKRWVDHGTSWGMKDPRTADYIEDYLWLIPRAHYLRLRRPRQEIFDSFKKWYGKSWSDDLIAETIDRRERNLDDHLPRDATTEITVEEVRGGQYRRKLEQIVAPQC